MLYVLIAPESLRLYRAIVAEAERLPQLGRMFYEAGPAIARDTTARLLGRAQSGTVAAERAAEFIQLVLGDVYLHAVLNITPADVVRRRKRQIEAAVRHALR